jgi:hypothetical protein
MMTPNMGLMAHVLIHANDDGTSNDQAATASTIKPIQRAMKSHTFFIITAAKIVIFLPIPAISARKIPILQKKIRRVPRLRLPAGPPRERGIYK